MPAWTISPLGNAIFKIVSGTSDSKSSMQWISVSSKSNIRVFFWVWGNLGFGKLIDFFEISYSDGLSTYFIYYSD